MRVEAVGRKESYLSEYTGVKPCLVKEADGNLSGDNAGTTGISLSEELAVDSLLVGGKLKVGPGCFGGGLEIVIMVGSVELEMAYSGRRSCRQTLSHMRPTVGSSKERTEGGEGGGCVPQE